VAVPDFPQGGIGNDQPQAAGTIPYTDTSGKRFAFSSVGTTGHFLRSGGTGTPTFYDLFNSQNVWTNTQRVQRSGSAFSWGSNGVRARLGEVGPSDMQWRVNAASAGGGTADDPTQSQWAVRLTSAPALDDFAIFHSPPGTGGFSAQSQFRIIGSTGVVGINQNEPGAQLDVRPSSTGIIGFRVFVPSGQIEPALRWVHGGTVMGEINAKPNLSNLVLNSVSLGPDTPGPGVAAGRNTGAGSPAGGAPGLIRLTDATGVDRYLWPDDAGILRIHIAPPTGNTASASANANTTGTVVGTQSSSRAVKENILPVRDMAVPFTLIMGAADQLYSFEMKNHAFGNPRYVCGLIVDDAPPEFVLDREADTPFPNDAVLTGCLIGAVRYIASWMDSTGGRLEALESLSTTLPPRVDALESTVQQHDQHLTSIDSTLATMNGDLILLKDAVITGELPLRVANLETAQQTMTGQINGLQTTDVNLQSQIDTLAARVTALETP
jgi:hypothetical protein